MAVAKNDRTELFLMVLDGITRSNGHGLQLDMFRLDMRKKVHLKGGAALEQVPREAVETLTLDVLKNLLKSWLTSSPPGNRLASCESLDKTPPEFLPTTVSVSCFNSSPFRVCRGLCLKIVICTS